MQKIYFFLFLLIFSKFNFAQNVPFHAQLYKNSTQSFLTIVADSANLVPFVCLKLWIGHKALNLDSLAFTVGHEYLGVVVDTNLSSWQRESPPITVSSGVLIQYTSQNKTAYISIPVQFNENDHLIKENSQAINIILSDSLLSTSTKTYLTYSVAARNVTFTFWMEGNKTNDTLDIFPLEVKKHGHYSFPLGGPIPPKITDFQNRWVTCMGGIEIKLLPELDKDNYWAEIRYLRYKNPRTHLFYTVYIKVVLRKTKF